MDQITRSRLQARARILKAMAQPSRILIVEEIARGPRSVQELTSLVGSDMSTVSKHLLQLRTAGIVSDRKQGTQVYYSLKTPCVLRFFECVGEVLETAAKESTQHVNIA